MPALGGLHLEVVSIPIQLMVTGVQSNTIASALQPQETNGWQVGSHAGLATWDGTTNAAMFCGSDCSGTGTITGR